MSGDVVDPELATSGPVATPRRARRPRLRLGTWLALGLGGVAAVLAARERVAADRSASPIVANEAGQRRVFPSLGDYAASAATIELQRAGGPIVRIVPDVEGHVVTVDGVVLGPADPAAVEGIWSSLRMATTLRTASDTSVSDGGHIRVSLPDLAWTLTLGTASPDGVGVYGVLDGPEGGTWVVERELSWLVDQEPGTWVSKRLLELEPSAVTSVAWGDTLALARGQDGIWRANLGGGRELLNTATVERRLARIFGTRLDPFVARDKVDAGDFRPWLVVGLPDGRTRTLVHGGACPGAPELVLVDRGPGELGCVPSSLVDPWPVSNPDAALVETRLVPWAYGRIVEISLEEGAAPGDGGDDSVGEPTRALLRRGGGWIVREGGRDRDVSEPEVYRWATAIGDLEVALEDAPVGELAVEFAVVVASDSTEKLRVECGRVADSLWCSRDGAPPRRVLGDRASLLRFDAEQFQDRTMLAFSSDDVRAIELLPGDEATSAASLGTGWRGVRQAARLDLGVWRLDAPDHPEGDAALDDVRANALVATLAGLRGEQWIDGEIDPRVVRTLHVELAAGARVSGGAAGTSDEGAPGAGPAAIDVVLHPDCVVSIAGSRAAKVDPASCEDLSADLLYVDPIAGALRTARSVRFDVGTARERVVRREGSDWHGEDGVTDLDATQSLARLEALRVGRLVQRREGASGSVDSVFGAKATRLEVRREQGDLTFVVGPDADAPRFLQVVGQSWLYVVVQPNEGQGEARIESAGKALEGHDSEDTAREPTGAAPDAGDD